MNPATNGSLHGKKVLVYQPMLEAISMSYGRMALTLLSVAEMSVALANSKAVLFLIGMVALGLNTIWDKAVHQTVTRFQWLCVAAYYILEFMQITAVSLA
jgi:hypothetical protein